MERCRTPVQNGSLSLQLDGQCAYEGWWDGYCFYHSMFIDATRVRADLPVAQKAPDPVDVLEGAWDSAEAVLAAYARRAERQA